MRRVILTLAALGLAVLMVTDVQAFSWPGRRLRGRGYTRPAPTVQFQPGRTFSYQPARASTERYRPYCRGYTGKAYGNAINK